MTASGNTSLTSCADTPENLSPFLSYPSDSASSLCSYVNPFNLSSFATAFSIGWISVLSLISEVKAVMLPAQEIAPLTVRLLLTVCDPVTANVLPLNVKLVSEFALVPPDDVIILLLPAFDKLLIATVTVLNAPSPA